MKNKAFMIDIEATGLGWEESLLQVAILECRFGYESPGMEQNYGDRLWWPGRSLNLFQRYEGEPKSEFARTQMEHVYSKCKMTPEFGNDQLRHLILSFLKECGAETRDDVVFMGWNASDFDIPFLCRKGILDRPGYKQVEGKDVATGDYNYRIYGLSGAVYMASDVLNMEREALLKRADDPQTNGFTMPPGRAHDALYDCYAQLRTLNGLLQLLKK
jgi:hypothetical protein